MPKDDDELIKKRPHEVDEEDEDFDEMIGKSREEDEESDEDDDKWDAPRKAAAAAAKRRSAAGDEANLSEEELEAASKPVFGASDDDEDPLDAEDEEEEAEPALQRRNAADEPTEQEDLSPKPTFKYNAPPPPSEEPTIIGEERTLDDLSEEELESRPTFKVDRGVPTEEEAPDERPTYPRPVQNEPREESEEEFGFRGRSSDNLQIPGIRKPASGPYPPHRNLAHDYDPDLEPDYQPVRPHQNPMRGANAPYAPDQNSRFGGYRERNGKGASVMHIVILLLIGGAVIAATVYLLQNQFNFPGKPDTASTPAPTPLVAEATPAPTPTPAPLERSQFKVRVLNGTTTAGLAGQTMTKLKGLGYQSDRSGNAPKQDFTTTTIRVKDGEASLAAQLTKDLAPDYNVASIAADLKSTDSANAEIILGK